MNTNVSARVKFVYLRLRRFNTFDHRQPGSPRGYPAAHLENPISPNLSRPREITTGATITIIYYRDTQLYTFPRAAHKCANLPKKYGVVEVRASVFRNRSDLLSLNPISAHKSGCVKRIIVT